MTRPIILVNHRTSFGRASLDSAGGLKRIMQIIWGSVRRPLRLLPSAVGAAGLRIDRSDAATFTDPCRGIQPKLPRYGVLGSASLRLRAADRKLLRRLIRSHR